MGRQYITNWLAWGYDFEDIVKRADAEIDNQYQWAPHQFLKLPTALVCKEKIEPDIFLGFETNLDFSNQKHGTD